MQCVFDFFIYDLNWRCVEEDVVTPPRDLGQWATCGNKLRQLVEKNNIFVDAELLMLVYNSKVVIKLIELIPVKELSW